MNFASYTVRRILNFSMPKGQDYKGIKVKLLKPIQKLPDDCTQEKSKCVGHGVSIIFIYKVGLIN